MRKKKESTSPQPFYKRFNIDVGLPEAQRRFINRVENQVFHAFFALDEKLKDKKWWYVRNVANNFGEVWKGGYQNFSDFVGNDFLKCLQALEVIYLHAEDEDGPKSKYSKSWMLSIDIDTILSQSEVDLCVTWRGGRFYPSGAKELDEALVNQPLDWLRKKGYESVLKPYSKALEHYLNSVQKPELLSDVVTDLYESLEALAKIVTGRPEKDLSANREAFLKKLKASEAYKTILKEYIKYANEFRHAAEEAKGKTALNRQETESFLYLTGLFIRMAMT
jgi:hypothetical protein